jgi:hypothetical protein
LTGGTGLLHLHLHHTHVDVLCNLAASLTILANTELSTLCPTSPTLLAVDVSADANHLLRTFVQVF